MIRVLKEILQEMENISDYKESFEMMVKRIAHALSTDACSIFLLDRHHGEYVLVATYGLNQQAVGKVRIPMNQGLIGMLGEREEPLNLDDAPTHPRFLHVPFIKEEHLHTFLGIPLIFHRQVQGVLVVQGHQSKRYDVEEEAFLVTLGMQLAALIAHADVSVILRSLTSDVSNESALVYSGVPGAPGIGIGEGVVVSNRLHFEMIEDRIPDDIESEIKLLDNTNFENSFNTAM